MFKSCGLPVERLNHGKPILGPTTNWWESGVAFNPTGMLIRRSRSNESMIANLLGPAHAADPEVKDALAVVQYRARPAQEEAGRTFSRSFTGLALCTPELKIVRRYSSPVITPGEDPADCDYFGIEDGRLSEFDGAYYYLYCGASLPARPSAEWPVHAQLCLATSSDLLHWKKHGPLMGNINLPESNNKDGVFFPEKIDGKYFLLHRPCCGSNYSSFAISLAMSDSLAGPWQDLGVIKRSTPNPSIARHIWVGAGSVPISLGNKRYLVIYHRGHVLLSGTKWYDLHAAIFDFNYFDPQRPGSIIRKRLERLMIPETRDERVAVSRDGVSNVVFTCGSYVHNGYIYILYGGADCCTMGARVRKDLLLSALEECDDFAAPVDGATYQRDANLTIRSLT